jgi:radical SAM-linked protein
MARDKVRIRFRKDGDLRLLSHHDLMRSFERMLRRAALPFRSSEGFHPTPRIVFALSLPLGVVGRREVVELELTEEVDPDEVLERLRQQAPPGIAFLSARRIPTNVTAQPRQALYGLPIPAGQVADLSARCAAFLDRSSCWVERLRPTPRKVNIRPYVNTLIPGPDGLEMALWVLPEGTARADEVVTALALGHLLDNGGVLERTDLLLVDEMDSEEVARAPTRPPGERTVPTDKVPVLAREQQKEAPAAAHWGASPNGPVVE